MENSMTAEQLSSAALIILAENVIFTPLKRTLKRGNVTVALTENEACLLRMLLEKTCSKREIMYEIWEKRGVIVTDSSYYKLVRQLRLSFIKIELDEKLIMTLPRIGILYTGTKSMATPNAPKNRFNWRLLKSRPLVSIIIILIGSIGFISKAVIME
ncbi:hypothetical protein [Serratia sp. AKBS12]|uniref:winged helix-turn-helix domain-containing protein n=1 Tax=Serratia sp. AKBS12 TaxID=2974597 RepID=UPI002165C3DE|nr:hypothetical protein [Serratia sp. AKBS12]MCS3409168.1 hypothetical protein [Serratia sp. AKBS12]